MSMIVILFASHIPSNIPEFEFIYVVWQVYQNQEGLSSRFLKLA